MLDGLQAPYDNEAFCFCLPAGGLCLPMLVLPNHKIDIVDQGMNSSAKAGGNQMQQGRSDR